MQNDCDDAGRQRLLLSARGRLFLSFCWKKTVPSIICRKKAVFFYHCVEKGVSFHHSFKESCWYVALSNAIRMVPLQEALLFFFAVMRTILWMPGPIKAGHRPLAELRSKKKKSTGCCWAGCSTTMGRESAALLVPWGSYHFLADGAVAINIMVSYSWYSHYWHPRPRAQYTHINERERDTVPYSPDTLPDDI